VESDAPESVSTALVWASASGIKCGPVDRHEHLAAISHSGGYRGRCREHNASLIGSSDSTVACRFVGDGGGSGGGGRQPRRRRAEPVSAWSTTTPNAARRRKQIRFYCLSIPRWRSLKGPCPSSADFQRRGFAERLPKYNTSVGKRQSTLQPVEFGFQALMWTGCVFMAVLRITIEIRNVCLWLSFCVTHYLWGTLLIDLHVFW